MSGALRWRYVRSAVDVWRHYRLQAVLSVLGVAAGVGGLMLVFAVGEGARREVDRSLGMIGAGTMLVRSPTGATGAGQLDSRRVAAVDRLLGDRLQRRVPVVVRQQSVALPGQRLDAVRVIGTTGDYAGAYRLAVHTGRFLTAHDVERRQRVCVLGWETGRVLSRQGPAVGRQLQVGDGVCTIVGHLRPAHRADATLADLKLPDFDRAVYVPVSGFGDGRTVELDELLLAFSDENDLLHATGAVQRVLEYGNDLAALEYVIPVELLRQKLRLQTVMRYLLAGTTLIMLVVGGVGITNMMLFNVLRRRPEIGLRRAVGATRTEIIVQFVVESMLVAGAGGIVGVVAGSLAALLLAALLGWAVAIPAWAVLLGLVVSLLLGATFGGYPALQAASVEPIRTLNQG